MKILGRRADGALQLSIGAGMAVLLRGTITSPPVSILVSDKLGPWHPVDNSLETRRVAERRLNAARVVPIGMFNLGLSFDEQRDRVMTALRAKLGQPSPSMGGMPGMAGMTDSTCYIPTNGLGDDWVVYCQAGKYWGLAYTSEDDGEIEFAGQPVEVRQTWESFGDEDEEPEADVPTFDEAVAVSPSEEVMAPVTSVDFAHQPAVQLRRTEWFKNFMSAKKKELMEKDLSGQLNTVTEKEWHLVGQGRGWHADSDNPHVAGAKAAGGGGTPANGTDVGWVGRPENNPAGREQALLDIRTAQIAAAAAEVKAEDRLMASFAGRAPASEIAKVAQVSQSRAREGFGGSRTPAEGDRVKVMGKVNGAGKMGRVSMTAPSGSFHSVRDSKGNSMGSYHSSDLKVRD